MDTKLVEIAARFRSADGAEIIFSAASISSMIDAAASACPTETGGILIGRYSDDLTTAWVEQASPKPKDSVAGPTWFVRGRRGIRTMLAKFWKDGRHYVGEWHSHPCNSPAPSRPDLIAIQKIARNDDFNCKRPILAVLGGDFRSSSQLSVTLGSRNGEPERLAETTT